MIMNIEVLCINSKIPFSKLGGEIEQTICDYAEKDLLLPIEETAMIPRSAKICHCVALYERLSWHRSLRSIANDQNLFELASTNTGEKKLYGFRVISILRIRWSTLMFLNLKTRHFSASNVGSTSIRASKPRPCAPVGCRREFFGEQR